MAAAGARRTGSMNTKGLSRWARRPRVLSGVADGVLER